MNRVLKWAVAPNPLFAMIAYSSLMGIGLGQNSPLKFLIAGMLFAVAFHFYLRSKRA